MSSARKQIQSKYTIKVSTSSIPPIKNSSSIFKPDLETFNSCKFYPKNSFF